MELVSIVYVFVINCIDTVKVLEHEVFKYYYIGETTGIGKSFELLYIYFSNSVPVSTNSLAHFDKSKVSTTVVAPPRRKTTFCLMGENLTQNIWTETTQEKIETKYRPLCSFTFFSIMP